MVIDGSFISVPTTAGYLAPGQSDVSVNGYITTSTSAATTITLRTVSTGKKFIITDVCLQTDLNKTAQYLVPVIQKNGVTMLTAIIHDLNSFIEAFETQIGGVVGDVFTLVIPATPSGAVHVAYRLGQIEF